MDSAKRAIEINSRASSYYYVLATLYKRAGKATESRAALEQFTKLDRESNEIDRKRREVTSGETHGAQLPARPDGSARAQ
jgi:hypothetical protein